MRFFFYILSFCFCAFGMFQCTVINPRGSLPPSDAAEVTGLWVIGFVLFVGAAVLSAISDLKRPVSVPVPPVEIPGIGPDNYPGKDVPWDLKTAKERAAYTQVTAKQ